MMDCQLSHRLEGTGPPLELGASLENSIVIAAGSRRERLRDLTLRFP
jgi:hypothetical protein